MLVAMLYGGFWTIFFLLSVHSSLKKKKKKTPKKGLGGDICASSVP